MYIQQPHVNSPCSALSEYTLKKHLLAKRWLFFPLNRNVHVYFTRNAKFLFHFSFNEKWNIRQANNSVCLVDQAFLLLNMILTPSPQSPSLLTIRVGASIHRLGSDAVVLGRRAQRSSPLVLFCFKWKRSRKLRKKNDLAKITGLVTETKLKPGLEDYSVLCASEGINKLRTVN